MTQELTINLDAEDADLKAQRQQVNLYKQNLTRAIRDENAKYRNRSVMAGRKRSGLMGLFRQASRTVANSNVQALEEQRGQCEAIIAAIDAELLSRR